MPLIVMRPDAEDVTTFPNNRGINGFFGLVASRDSRDDYSDRICLPVLE